MMKTRSANFLSILDEHPGSDWCTINGSKLPTYKEVLMCLISHIEDIKQSPLFSTGEPAKFKAAKKTTEQIVKLYSKLEYR